VDPATKTTRSRRGRWCPEQLIKTASGHLPDAYGVRPEPPASGDTYASKPGLGPSRQAARSSGRVGVLRGAYTNWTSDLSRQREPSDRRSRHVVEGCPLSSEPGSDVLIQLAVGRVKASQRACLVRPWSAGRLGLLSRCRESVDGTGAHTDGMRPPDHDHGSVGVVRAAVVAKGRPPN
jgi:hypothetical protein